MCTTTMAWICMNMCICILTISVQPMDLGKFGDNPRFSSLFNSFLFFFLQSTTLLFFSNRHCSICAPFKSATMSRYHPSHLTTHTHPHTSTGPPRPHSNLQPPNPIPIPRQIPNRDPLRRHKLLRPPPNPRQIPTPARPPMDQRRRVRRDGSGHPDGLVLFAVQTR